MIRKVIENRYAALGISLLAILIIWHVSAGALQKAYLPTPRAIADAFMSEWANGNLWIHSIASIKRMAIGIGAGVAVAVPLAILSAEYKLFNQLLSPLMEFLYPIPKVVFLPIIVFIFGLGDPSIIFLVAIIMLFQVFIIVRDSISTIPQATIDALTVLGANGYHRIRFIYFPASMSAAITAVKVSIGTAIGVLFIAESIGNNVGLGYYIVVDQWNRFAYAKVYAGVLTISAIGSLAFAGLAKAESVLNRWRRA